MFIFKNKGGDENVAGSSTSIGSIFTELYGIIKEIKDEHSHIGEGLIGKEGIKLLINHEKLKHLPFILETPQFEGRDKDVEIVKSLKEK